MARRPASWSTVEQRAATRAKLDQIGELRKDGRQFRLDHARRLRVVPEPAIDEM